MKSKQALINKVIVEQTCIKLGYIYQEYKYT